MAAAREKGMLEKGLDLLDQLSRDGGRTDVSVLTRDLALPTSTAYRLLTVLQRQGLLVRVGKGRYLGGARLLDWADATDMARILRHSARPVLRSLARSSGLTAHLGILDGGMVTYLIKESGGGPPVFTEEGKQLEAYCSGIGKMLLSALPVADREAYLADGPFVALTPYTLTDPATLRQSLDAITTNDYALDDREIAPDLQCLAVPVRAADQRVVAAISLAGSPGLNYFADIARSAEVLQDCARRISEAVWPRVAAPLSR